MRPIPQKLRQEMAGITLLGRPISTNNCYYHAGRGLTFLKAKARDLKSSYCDQILKQWKKEPLDKELEIHIKIYHDRKTKSDWDNFHKLSMDAMNGLVWVDDSQIQKATVEKFYDKANPRIEIDIL